MFLVLDLSFLCSCCVSVFLVVIYSCLLVFFALWVFEVYDCLFKLICSPNGLLVDNVEARSDFQFALFTFVDPCFCL